MDFNCGLTGHPDHGDNADPPRDTHLPGASTPHGRTHTSQAHFTY